MKVILNLPDDTLDIDDALDELAICLAQRNEEYIRGFLSEVLEPDEQYKPRASGPHARPVPPKHIKRRV